MAQQERNGVFLVRAWLEGGRPGETLRARITSTVENDQPGPPDESAASSPEEVEAALRTWLAALTAGT